MISIVWPYWNRQAVADRAAALLAEHYAGNIELVVVDDGSPVPYVAPPMPFKTFRFRMQSKSVPLNPCVPINVGVAAAIGDVIALSGPDIMHVRPILADMRAELGDDKSKYVMAAVWCPDLNRWHCHSKAKRGDAGDVGSLLPPGADYHFMTMFHRELWQKAGGFDEDYRDGAGYDDPDFCMRLARAGAKFVMRDDLVVEHVRSGAESGWTREMYDRNRALFFRKWGFLSAYSAQTGSR